MQVSHEDKKRKLEPATANVVIGATTGATTLTGTTTESTSQVLSSSSDTVSQKKSLPRISGFALIQDDSVQATSVLAFIPRIRGEDGLDACVTALWDKQRKHGGTICAVYSPQLITRDGKMELKTFQGKAWHFAPSFLHSKRNKLAMQAEAQMVEGKYLPKFKCMNCHAVRANGKGCEPPPHKFFGDFSKGGCMYPPDLFDQGHSDYLDEILEERDQPPKETGESPEPKPAHEGEDEEVEEIDAE